MSVSFNTTIDIGSINTVLDQVNISREKNAQGPHLYVVVHPIAHTIGITHDKANASSLYTISEFIKTISVSIFNDIETRTMNRKQILALSNHMATFVKKSQKKGLLAKVTAYICSFFAKTKQTHTNFGNIQENIEKNLYTYGYREKEKEIIDPKTKKPFKSLVIQQVLGYSKEAAKRLEQRRIKEEQEKITEWTKFFNYPHNRSIEQFSKAFAEELYPNFNHQFYDQKVQYKLISDIFTDILSDMTIAIEKNELSPDEAFEQFEERFGNRILEKNHYSEAIDCNTFRDMMGRYVKDGKGKVAQDIPGDVDLITAWIEDYNNDTWKQDEERTLEYKLISDQDLFNLNTVLTTIVESKNFKEALSLYFHGVKKISPSLY